MLPRKARGPPHRRLCAHALATGEAVEDGRSFQHRLAHIHQRVVQHPLAEARRADDPLIWIVDGEAVVFADDHAAGQQFLAQRCDIPVQILLKGAAVRLGASALGGFLKGQAQIGRLGDGVHELSVAFHGVVEVEGVPSSRSSASPYLSMRASPTPSFSAFALRQSRSRLNSSNSSDVSTSL